MKQRTLLKVSVLLAGITVLGASTEAAPFWRRGDDDRKENVDRKNEKRKLKRQRVRGTVERVSGQIAYVRTGERVVAVRLGPEAYWEAHGYRLVPGTRVNVVGWADPYGDRDALFATRISAPGTSIALANRRGIPLWVTDYEYRRGWHPTYDTYLVWYRPAHSIRADDDRIDAPPGHVKDPPPGHTKGAPPGHTRKKAPPEREERGESERRDDRSRRGGPRGR